MTESFSKGETVRLSVEGRRTLSNRRVDQGVVASIPRDPDLVGVRWNGHKTVQTIHRSFIEKVAGA